MSNTALKCASCFYKKTISLLPKTVFLISVRNETHYDVLKLPHSCSAKDIREAFISLSKQNHPDKNRNDPSMHVRFVKINEAYNTLIKPSSRRAYDMSLHSKRKLNPPYNEAYQQNQGYYEYETTKDQGFEHPFTWTHKERYEAPNYNDDTYYGVKGIKRVSNTVILWFLFGFTMFGILVQIIAIRNSAYRINEKLKEESRKNTILYNLAREKAKLYGNDYQIEVLKKSLRVTYDLPSEEQLNEDPVINNEA